MQIEYLMLITAGILVAVQFALTNLYNKGAGVTPSAGLKFNVYNGAFTAIIFWIISGFSLEFSWFSFGYAALSSIPAVIYTLIGFRIMKKAGLAINTLFLMTGGMVVPYVFGLVFLNENFMILGMVGLLLIIGSVVLSNFSSSKVDTSVILMCIAVFFLNGIVSISTKLHQMDVTHVKVSEMQFVVFTGIVKFVCCYVALLFMKDDEKTEKRKQSLPKLMGIVGISALAGGLSYMLQLMGAKGLPAVVCFPFVTGGAIIFTSLISAMFFKEKLSGKFILSVALSFAGTCVFLFT